VKVLLCGINYSPELTGIGKYSGEMASWLAGQAGHEVKVITAPPYYPEWEVGDGYSRFLYKREKIEGVDVIRCPLYVPKKMTELKRLIHLISFSLTSFIALISQLFWRPDVVVVVVPTFFCVPFALLYAKLVGAKSVVHIQDYELDAMLGLGMLGSDKNLLVTLALRIERFFLRRFDMVSTISYSMIERAKHKGVVEAKTVFFPNWVDTSFITPVACRETFRKLWGYGPDDKVILYSGNIGNKQGLELVLKAAESFQCSKGKVCDDKVRFVIVGQGTYRSRLEAMAADMKLNNVEFRDLVSYEDLPDLMAMADVHLVVQKCGAADVVLPSKLTSILSAGGHGLITAEANTELGLLCSNNVGIAERVEPENLNAFISGLNNLLAKDTKSHNKVARQYALDSLNKDAVLQSFEQSLSKLKARSTV
jgi:colanic acid biosynthesis glycosyl transferase WcaI